MRNAVRSASTTLGAVGIAIAARRAWRSPTVRVARMTGTSISTPDAAGWVTDFLNAAYFARRPQRREVEDLRLATAILTTRWHRLGHRRLHAPDVAALHRAFARERFLDGRRTPRGTLDREQLLAGAKRLLGGWFAEVYGDDARRAHGIALETHDERDAYRPDLRLRQPGSATRRRPRGPRASRSGTRTSPCRSRHPRRSSPRCRSRGGGPDFGTDIRRFTAVRSRGLDGQTFEIEIIMALAPRKPALVRGYATVTRLLLPEERPRELDAYVAQLDDRMVRVGRDQPPPVPDGASAVLALELTTHEEHFMGRGVKRLLLYEHEAHAYLRATGTWDDMPLTLERAYRSASRQAQGAFWGNGRTDSSMLVQIALRTGSR
jgi:hypothetical protein